LARSPGGKSVGRVSIRVIPDTSRFREDLKTALDRIENNTRLEIDANLAARAQFHKDVRDLIDAAESNKVNLAVAATTAAAAAQIRYTSRPRIVPLIVRVRQASLLAAEAALLRLTGLRSAANYTERFARSLGNLDKNLPRLTLITTGITSLVSILLSALSGLLGIGAGLTAILPALLVVPGLLAGGIASVAVLAIALADAREQLAELGPSMRELGTLIQDNFWTEARRPIIDFIQNLLPQLRAVVGATATAIGGFVANMANSFDREFANGRFEAVFAGIPATFRELSRGTDAFAGAIVSLGLIASRYVPRLASWFVDLSIRFDNFLKQTAEDGRLDAWIEGAIKAMDDLWRATAATGRALAGLWRAAESAGGGGLSGFADNMERIDKVINGPRFQRTMEAIFRGANTATSGIADGLRTIGTLLHDRRADVEFFIGTAGQALGRLMSDIANALNTPEVGGAVRDFISGIDRGLAGFGKYLPDVASAAASLMSFAGAFAETLGPTLGSAASAVSGALKPILDTLTDGTLQSLGDTIKTALDDLGPKLARTAEVLAPMIDAVLMLAEKIIPELAEAIGGLLDGFNTDTPDQRNPEGGPFDGLGELIRGGTIFTTLQMWTDWINGHDIAVKGLRGEYGVMWQEIGVGMAATILGFEAMKNAVINSVRGAATAIISTFASTFAGVVATVQTAVTGIGVAIATIPAVISTAFRTAGTWLYQAGRDMIQGFINGITSWVSRLVAVAVNAASAAFNAAKKVLGIASPSKRAYSELGVPVIQGWVNAIRDNAHLVAEEMVRASTFPKLPQVDVGTFGAGIPEALAALAGNTLNMTVINPVGVPTEESVRRESQLIGAGLAI
jgi:hypothetical protein